MISKQNINKIINIITPKYNYYVKNKSTLSGNKSLKIMWNIGNILESYINDLNINPHNLYRQIYGKSEGNKYIIQKSYITREFQSRCYRIKKIFKSKNEIDILLPNLVSFTCFREAMPFFDNDKYVFDGKNKKNLLNILNSNNKSTFVMKEIKNLQKKYIGKKNPRTQRLKELDAEKTKFIFIYNSIFNLLKNSDYDSTRQHFDNISNDNIVRFAQLVSALISEEIIPPEMVNKKNLVEPFVSLNELLLKLHSKKKMTERNRFRRLVPPERISSLANMIFALSSKEIFNNYKIKKGLINST